MENEAGKTEIQTGVPRIRTYERDVEEFMKKEGGTAADFALAEQERRIKNTNQVDSLTSRPFIRGSTPSETRGEGVVSTGTQPAPLRPDLSSGHPPLERAGGERKISIPSPQTELVRRNARALILWSILFLFLAGAVGIVYWYVSNLEPKDTAPVRIGTANILLVDKEKALDASRLTRDTLITAFTREREAALALSSFTLVTLTKPAQSAGGETAPRALTASEFLALLDTSARGDLVRALTPEFALGIRGLPTNRAFLIFKTNYYQTVLAGMLAWEETLLNDLGPLFGGAINETLPSETSDTFTNRVSRFTDRTINNRDVRELIGSDGKPLLLYGFANKQTLIIVDDEDSFEKTMEKLTANP